MNTTTQNKTEKEWNIPLLSKKEVVQKPTNKDWKMIQLFHNVDFRYGHDGLYEICKQNKIDLDKIEQGNFVAFFNSAKNSIKLAFSSNDIFYHREGRKIDERIILDIQNRLNMSGKVQMNDAQKDFIVRELKKRGRLDENNTKIN